MGVEPTIKRVDIYVFNIGVPFSGWVGGRELEIDEHLYKASA